MVRLNLLGETYGRLTVVANGSDRGYDRWLICLCECGQSAEVSLRKLRGGRTKSCGCLRRETAQQGTHYASTTRLYRIWAHMKGRCNNPNQEKFQYYGGRGITYSPEWETFPGFKEWAEANGYQEHLTIERQDNDGNYEPPNCTWATRVDQARNRSSNQLTPKSVEHVKSRLSAGWSCPKIARELGVKNDVIRRVKAGLSWYEDKTSAVPPLKEGMLYRYVNGRLELADAFTSNIEGGK